MGLIPEDIIRQVVERTDIVELINGYVPLKRAGRNFKANCPFHQEKTPSFMVNPAKQIFHCFGCGAGGNAVAFVMKYDRLEFPEAVRLLAEKANIVIPETLARDQKPGDDYHKTLEINALALDFFHQNLLFDRSDMAQNARDYLKSRHISQETVKSLKIGYAPESWDALLNHLSKKGMDNAILVKTGLVVPRNSGTGVYDRFRNRVMFPILDVRGQCRAFGGRTLNNDPAKYINSPETPVYTKGHHVFGLHQAKQSILDQDEAVIVEGYMDCVMPHQFGVTNVVAALGTALTSEQVRLLSRYTKNIILLFDADPAGEAAMMRSLDLCVEEGVNVRLATLTDGEDPDSFLRKFGVEAFRARLAAAENVFDYKFGRLFREFGTSGLEQKSKIVHGMLPMIRKFPDEVLRAGYLKELAQRLSISEEAVGLEFKKISTSSAWDNAAGDKTLSRAVIQTTLKNAEWQILRLMLEDRVWAKSAFENLSSEDFQHGAGRQVAKMIFDRIGRNQDVQAALLLNECEGDHVREYLTALLVEEETLNGDKGKIFQDCLARMKSDRRKNRRQELLKAISQAEKEGDWAVLQSLQEEFSRMAKTS